MNIITTTIITIALFSIGIAFFYFFFKILIKIIKKMKGGKNKMPRKDAEEEKKQAEKESAKIEVVTENQLFNLKLDRIINLLESVIQPAPTEVHKPFQK